MEVEMKTLMTAALLIATAMTAQAQSPKQKHLDIINCSALKGQPQVCLFNDTDLQVTDIDCETTSFFSGKGAKAVDVPRGGIPAHSITIVNMKSCKTALIFTLLGGGERRVDHINTDQSTIIEVPQK